ncbi:MAG: Rpn family recombination-promoting nuclease/putative transposase, partial [Neisseriaceae bacterium]
MAHQLIKKHDALAKCFLTNLDIAKKFLTLYLEAEIKSKCDFRTLTVVGGSFVKNDLTKLHSDIVYRMDLKDKSSCAYIYMLEENQSTPLKLMLFRVLEYTVAIIKKHIDDYGESGGLPIVVPVVLYNGDDYPYPHFTDIKDLFADKDLFDKVGLGVFKLVDLTTKDDSEILKHGKLALLEMVKKHIRVRDFSEVIGRIMEAILVAHKDNLTTDTFSGAWQYLSNAREREELVPLMKQVIDISDYKEFIMSYSETLRQEGMQEAQIEMVQEMLK